jgi:hypothetical protein
MGEWRYTSMAFLTSARDERSVSHPSPFTSGERSPGPLGRKLNRTECVRIKSIINVPKGIWRKKVHILFRQTQHVETDQFSTCTD